MIIERVRTKIDKTCDPDCGKDEYTQPFAMFVDAKLVKSCKDSWGAFSCPLSPANKEKKKETETT